MIKLVNVNARIPIRNVTPPIQGYHAGIEMSSEDILKCLSRRAIVDEILKNGKTLRLTMKNYYTDNNTGIESVVEETPGVVVPEVDTTSNVKEPVPVVDETTAEEEPTVVETPVVDEEPQVESSNDEEIYGIEEDTDADEDEAEDSTEVKSAPTANVSTSTPSRSKKKKR